jgi:hypothetical protein
MKYIMKDILVDWTMQEARKLIGEFERSAWKLEALNKPLEVLVEVISSPSTPTKPADLTVAAAKLNAASISQSNTASISQSDDQAWLHARLWNLRSRARKAAPGCESLVGVVVQRTTPKSRFDTNLGSEGCEVWQRQSREGQRSDAIIVERMQREFRLSDDEIDFTPRRAVQMESFRSEVE